jgi:hypothetical protein
MTLSRCSADEVARSCATVGPKRTTEFGSRPARIASDVFSP